MQSFLSQLTAKLRARLGRKQSAGEARPGVSLVRRHPIATASVALILFAAAGMFVFLYISYARLINDRLGNGSLRTSSSIFASPKLLATGEQISPAQLIAHLQRASYTEAAD